VVPPRLNTVHFGGADHRRLARGALYTSFALSANAAGRWKREGRFRRNCMRQSRRPRATLPIVLLPQSFEKPCHKRTQNETLRDLPSSGAGSEPAGGLAGRPRAQRVFFMPCCGRRP